jgi:16S rRNA processing protein RimM
LANPRAESQPRPVVVGKITAPHGVAGWLKVFSHTRPPEQLLHYADWLLAARADAAQWTKVQPRASRQRARQLFVKLDVCNDRNAAEALRGHWIAIDPAQLAKLPPGEYYWSDLIGLAVINREAIALGAVDHLLETGANDVLVVRDGATERLLPWAPHVIVAVDLSAGRLVVDWPADDASS